MSAPGAVLAPIEYAEASVEVRAVYDDIMATRKVDWVNNYWKVLANHPATLRRMWANTKEVMGPGALDPANLALPVLGVIDDFLLLPLLLHVVVRFLPAAIRSDFAPRGRVIEIDRQSADRARPRAGSSRSQGR